MELVDIPLEMGMFATVNGLVLSAIFVFELTLSSYVFLISRAGSFRPFSPALMAPAPTPFPARRPRQRDYSAAGPSSHQEKMKRPVEFDLRNPSTVNLESLMAVSRGAAREAYAEHAQLERLIEISVTQLGIEKGYTPDFDIAEAVKKLS